MTLADVDSAAALHVAHLSYSLFAQIGLAFVRRLYRRLVLSPQGLAFVYEPDGAVRAFIAAAYDAAALRREFVWRDGWLAGAWVALAAMRRPSVIVRALETLTYGSRTDLPDVKAEMLFISLDPSLRRQGLARRLIDEVLTAFQQHGIDRVKVTTEAVNEPVNSLLDRLGFEQQTEFPFHGKRMVLHSRSLDLLPCPR